MLRAGAELVAFHTVEDDLAATFAERFPQAKRVADKREILEDHSIALIVSAAISSERADLAIEAMRHGKDVMLDKPGMVTLDQLADVRKVQAETKRIVSILYSEHFETASTVKAGELVKAGAIGKVIHTTGLGPIGSANPPGQTGSSTASAMAASSPTSPRISASSSCSLQTPSKPRCCRRQCPTAPIRKRRACRTMAISM